MTATFDHQPYVVDDAHGTNYHLMLGDSCERLAEIPDNSIDAIVTDPPYGLGFMG